MFDFATFNYAFWIAGGIILIALEFLIPGTFVSFVGISAILTGFISYIYPIGFFTQLMICSILSFVLIITGGSILRKMFPSDKEYAPIPEDDYVGQIARVTKKIRMNKKGGKIKFRGTFWEAVCLEDDIVRGQYVKILSRNNLTYIVEKADEQEVENYLNRNLESDDYKIN